jgi:hypothetical protein
VDFFSRLSRLSRIINVGDLTFGGLGEGHAAAYPIRPNTTVSGSCVVTTFFTTSATQVVPVAAKNVARPGAPAQVK